MAIEPIFIRPEENETVQEPISVRPSSRVESGPKGENRTAQARMLSGLGYFVFALRASRTRKRNVPS